MDERDFDRAQWLSEQERETALAKHRRAMAERGDGRTECEECGEPIPPERREAVKADLCVECQQLSEHRKRDGL